MFPKPTMVIFAFSVFAGLGCAQAAWSEDVGCQESECAVAFPSNDDDIGLMQVSLLQTGQHVHSAADSALLGIRGPGKSHSDSSTKVTPPTQGKITTDEGKITDESWYVGVVLALVGQTICVIGLQMQKISHNMHTPTASLNSPNNPTASDLLQTSGSKDLSHDGLVGEQSYYFLEWQWAGGASVWALGHIMCWVALGLAPQSVLACLQTWSIVVALALAPVLLNETLPPNAMTFATLLVIGCIIVMMAGPRSESYQKSQVASLEKAFIAPASLEVHAVCVLLFLVSLTASLLQGPYWASCRMEVYALVSAICGWYAAFWSKSMSMVVITSVASNESQLNNLGFWLFALAFVVCAVGQIHYMNLGLKYGLACTIMPMYEAISMVGQLFFGGILFGEFHHFQHPLGFVTGVLIVLIGLAELIRSSRSAAS